MYKYVHVLATVYLSFQINLMTVLMIQIYLWNQHHHIFDKVFESYHWLKSLNSIILTLYIFPLKHIISKNIIIFGDHTFTVLRLPRITMYLSKLKILKIIRCIENANISIRLKFHISTVIIYRPPKNKIILSKTGLA